MLTPEAKTSPVISIKDGLVVVPFLGSAIALSYEVGSFLPIGRTAFYLFSVAEHLLFALQALPIALVLACWCMVLIAVADASTSRRAGLWRRPRKRGLRAHVVRWVIRVTVVLFYIIGVALFWSGVKFEVFGFLILGLSVLSLAAVMSFSFTVISTRPRPVLLSGVIFVLLFAFALGIDSTNGLLKIADELTIDLNVDGLSKKAAVLRAGERGVLMFEPTKKVFSFVKWETIKSFEWEPNAGVR
ncbi:MAG TPA: hypothetical protein VN838_13890 [Bradyrhizobium sp.]|nr:hypothetical protein [Bradyrhizobium sp.]